MSSEDKDSGIRGRIDRFFDKRAKEQQDLLSGKIGGVNISDSWSSTKEKLAKKSKSNKKIHKVKSQLRSMRQKRLKIHQLVLWQGVLFA